MATITLYAGKVNQMSGIINDVKRSVEVFQSDLTSLKSKLFVIDSSVCNVNDVICSIRVSTQTQENKAETLERLEKNIDEFVSDVICIDSNAAEAINKSKDNFYDAYYYLKPACEKNNWEKFKDGCKNVGEWCKEHWKEIVAVAVIIAGVVLCFIPGLNGIGAGILIGALKGAISGALIGGLSSWASGGSFWEGVWSGAITGVIFGGVFGGLGAAGKLIGNAKALGLLRSGQWAGNSSRFIFKVSLVSKISGGITIALGGFDMLALGSKILFGNNWLSDFNASLHKSAIYNFTQTVIAGIAVFSGGMSKGFNEAANQAGVKPVCFVAGTMILTVMGLVVIENIKAGLKVISTDTETMKTAEKMVLDTYIREVDRLVHLVINGEEIITTINHPFYVNDRGFVNAGDLEKGAQLMDASGNLVIVKSKWIEILVKPKKVYNFKVEDFHTYHVGRAGVLVHNANGYDADLLGAKGPQISSKTMWKNGKTERIDIENPSPGRRPGQIHYHDPSNKCYYYDIQNNVFYDQKTGILAPRGIQKLLDNKNFFDAIKKALEFLGEKK